jgi:hypothetical protein
MIKSRLVAINSVPVKNMSDLTLGQICPIYNTDKNCLHSYVDHVYEDLFREIRHSANNILEIGVSGGGSLFMWREYFPNAVITGIDDKDRPQVKGRERIEFIFGGRL